MEQNAHPIDHDLKPQLPPLLARIHELERRNADLERANADIERVAAVVAHELLTPVVMIDSHAAAIADRLDPVRDADACRELDALRAVVARSQVVAHTLVHHARSAELHRAAVELDVLLRDGVALLAPAIRARRAEVVLGALPRVSADAAMIGAVFTNLLMNGLKYGPRGGGTIRVGANREPAGWRFVVESEGQTIALEDRNRIFEPYRRGRGERRARGSGLGLAICRDIVERHGGRIGVDAAEGGNCFYFTLPDG